LLKGVKISNIFPTGCGEESVKIFFKGFAQMAKAGVIGVLKKHFVIFYINMKLSFMFICILSVNT
jgi:hypothetical protein